MKKLLLTLTLFGAAFLGITNVNAEEVDLNDIDTNTYIIGDRIYELNVYPLSIYDVVSATNEYANNHNGAMAPIYYYGTDGTNTFLLEIKGVADANGIVPTETLEVEEVYPNTLMDATAINNIPLYDLIGKDIEPIIEESVELLNTTAENYGFKSVTYADKTVTFTIADLGRMLADYKNSGIADLFLDVIDGSKEITYTLDEVKTLGEEDLAVLTTDSVINLAHEVLTYLAGDAEELTYEAVANKAISGTITYVHNGYEYTETYTVEFVYDVVTVKDEVAKEAVETLATTAENYGFESITYENQTVTFTIADIDRMLADYRNSGVADLFLDAIDGASKITYALDEVKTLDEEDLAALTTDSVINLAHEVLTYLAGDATELTYEAVANKAISAEITFDVNGVETTLVYTVAFVYDVVEAKDEVAKEAVETLAATAENYGFESITYENQTVTFTIADIDRMLADYRNSGVADLFLDAIDGATKITYTLDEVKTLGEAELAALTTDSVINLAHEVLTYLAGDATELTYEAVANKAISAEITFDVNGVETTLVYTVAFVYDVVEAKDEVAKEAVETLATTAENYGFESITYENQTVTFTIADIDRMLADYKNSGVADLFLDAIDGATKITYALDEVKTLDEEDLAALTTDSVINLAHEVLTYLAGDATELTYEAVANRAISADITFDVNGVETTLTYTVAFVYDVVEAKNEEVKEAVNTLNSTASMYGFAEVAYNADTNTATFVVANEDALLADYKNSGIADLFLDVIDGATNITYTLDEVKTLGEDDLSVLTTDSVINLAHEVLTYLAGDAETLTLGSVAGKSISADVAYVINGVGTVVTYTVQFQMAE